ncbi:MAG TPA: hypothetical protein VGC84_01910 [Ilumatobacteraceae bacterium]|jgi:hypothetical protein
MKSIAAGMLASIAALGLLSSCGSDSAAKSDTSSAGATISAGATVPTDATASTGYLFPGEHVTPGTDSVPASAPAGGTIPASVVDQMIAQFEAAGMKVDKACFTALLKDDSLRKLVQAGGTPNQEAISKFFTCLSA